MIDTIDITPTRARFNGGQFDTDFRYLRKTSDGPRTTMLRGPSLAVRLYSADWNIAWRYECGGYVMLGITRSSSDAAQAPPTSVANTPSTIAL